MLSYLIKREIKKQLKNASARRQKRFRDYREITSAAFLAEHSQLEELKPVMQDLLAEGIQPYLVVLNAAGAEIDSEYPAVSVLELRPENLLWRKSLPDKQTRERFLALPTDILCDLTIQESLPLLYLASISLAVMKLGIEKNDWPLFDFSLAPAVPGSTVELAKNLFFYWKSIDIKDNNS